MTFAFDHISLSVADLDAQRRFYQQALGLVEEAHLDIPAARIRTAVLRGPTGPAIELVERGGSAPQRFADAYDGAGTQGYFHWALRVDDLDAALAGVLAAGARQVSAPADAARPGMRFAYVKDPEDNLLELVHLARQPVGGHPDRPLTRVRAVDAQVDGVVGTRVRIAGQAQGSTGSTRSAGDATAHGVAVPRAASPVAHGQIWNASTWT